MTNKKAIFDRDQLDVLHSRAAGSVKRGAVTWAAETLAVSRQTVHAWLAGKGRPTRTQFARLRVAASVAERARAVRADRLAGRGFWKSLAAWFANAEQRITESAVKRERERQAVQTRANRRFGPTVVGRDGEEFTIGRQRRSESWLTQRSRYEYEPLLRQNDQFGG